MDLAEPEGSKAWLQCKLHSVIQSLHSVEKAYEKIIQPGFVSQGRISQKQGYQWPHHKYLDPRIAFIKKQSAQSSSCAFACQTS